MKLSLNSIFAHSGVHEDTDDDKCPETEPMSEELPPTVRYPDFPNPPKELM